MMPGFEAGVPKNPTIARLENFLGAGRFYLPNLNWKPTEYTSLFALSNS